MRVVLRIRRYDTEREQNHRHVEYEAVAEPTDPAYPKEVIKKW